MPLHLAVERCLQPVATTAVERGAPWGARCRYRTVLCMIKSRTGEARRRLKPCSPTRALRCGASFRVAVLEFDWQLCGDEIGATYVAPGLGCAGRPSGFIAGKPSLNVQCPEADARGRVRSNHTGLPYLATAVSRYSTRRKRNRLLSSFPSEGSVGRGQCGRGRSDRSARSLHLDPGRTVLA